MTGRSITKTQPERRRLSFFVDASVSTNLVKILEIFDHRSTFEILRTRFVDGTPDEEWLGWLEQQNPKPIILCWDGEILRRKPQLAALEAVQTHFVVFVEGYGNLPFEQQVVKCLDRWANIRKAICSANEPKVFKVRQSSKKIDVLNFK